MHHHSGQASDAASVKSREGRPNRFGGVDPKQFPEQGRSVRLPLQQSIACIKTRSEHAQPFPVDRLQYA